MDTFAGGGGGGGGGGGAIISLKSGKWVTISQTFKYLCLKFSLEARNFSLNLGDCDIFSLIKFGARIISVLSLKTD